MRRCGCRVWEVGFCPLGGRKEETIKVRGTMVGGERGRQGREVRKRELPRKSPLKIE